MPDTSPQPWLDKPVTYRIVVKGQLDASWTEWFDGLTLTVARDETGAAFTTLSGPIADQGALHGLLARLRDLGLTLLEVRCSDAGSGSLPVNCGDQS